MLIFIPKIKHDTTPWLRSFLVFSAQSYARPCIMWSISIWLIHLSRLVLQISRKGPSAAHNSSAFDRWDVMHTLRQFNPQTPSAHCTTGTMCPSAYPQWHTGERWALQSNNISHIYRSTRHSRIACASTRSHTDTLPKFMWLGPYLVASVTLGRVTKNRLLIALHIPFSVCC